MIETVAAALIPVLKLFNRVRTERIVGDVAIEAVIVRRSVLTKDMLDVVAIDALNKTSSK